MTDSENAHLDLYDIAFLAGGTARVVDTALVDLVGTGRVRVQSPGELAVSDASCSHPVEVAVLDAVGPQGHRSVDTIHWRVEDDERMQSIGRRLADSGLLHRTPWPRRTRSRPLRLTRTRKGNGALAVVAAARAADSAPPDRTGAFLVAVSGIEAMPDTTLRASIFQRPRTTLAAPGRRTRTHEVDPRLAAYRIGGAATPGAGLVGFDGGFDGGGVGGGDGGG